MHFVMRLKKGKRILPKNKIYKKGNLKNNIIKFESYLNDSRLTEPSDGKHFRWRAMIDEAKRLDRALTDSEAEKFLIK